MPGTSLSLATAEPTLLSVISSPYITVIGYTLDILAEQPFITSNSRTNFAVCDFLTVYHVTGYTLVQSFISVIFNIAQLHH